MDGYETAQWVNNCTGKEGENQCVDESTGFHPKNLHQVLKKSITHSRIHVHPSAHGMNHEYRNQFITSYKPPQAEGPILRPRTAKDLHLVLRPMTQEGWFGKRRSDMVNRRA